MPDIPRTQPLDNANTIIVGQLAECARNLEEQFSADCLSVVSPIVGGLDDAIRRLVEDRNPRRQKLAVVIETSGGYIETAERMATVFRHHYSMVDFVVPNNAMSAGTVLAMSGDAIWMDYYSQLGPIDPQFGRPARGDGPGLGLSHPV